MSDVSRRHFIGGTAFFAAAVTGAVSSQKSSKAGDPSFMNNIPDSDLAGDELPTFKFELEKTKGKVIGNSSGKEATVKQLPISTGIAGVSMRLEPGAMRELHWHATAAEWAMVLEGRVRTTVISPDGTAAIDDFVPGDVWLFPRGYGHMLECLGNESCHFVLIFDNGYFSEFGTFSITDWMGHTPKELLAKNFRLPVSAFEDFPKEEVYFGRGAVPPEIPDLPLHGKEKSTKSHKYEMLSKEPDDVFEGGRAWKVDSTKFPISTTMTGVFLELEPGALRELHWHPAADEWQYVVGGDISVTLFGSRGRYRTETLHKGDVGYIPQGYGHSIENVGTTTCKVLIGFNSGIYEKIDLSEWIAGNPADVLMTNFSQPKSMIEKFPRDDVFIAK